MARWIDVTKTVTWKPGLEMCWVVLRKTNKTKPSESFLKIIVFLAANSLLYLKSFVYNFLHPQTFTPETNRKLEGIGGFNICKKSHFNTNSEYFLTFLYKLQMHIISKILAT